MVCLCVNSLNCMWTVCISFFWEEVNNLHWFSEKFETLSGLRPLALKLLSLNWFNITEHIHFLQNKEALDEGRVRYMKSLQTGTETCGLGVWQIWETKSNSATTMGQISSSAEPRMGSNPKCCFLASWERGGKEQTCSCCHGDVQIRSV